MTREEIFPTLQTLVSESLALPKNQVTRQSRFIDDLGADSLDVVDLLFAIKKKFNVNIQAKELNFLSNLDLSAPGAKDGFLSKEVIEKLKEYLPALNKVDDPEKVTPAQLFPLITVETLCILIEKKLSS